MNVNNNDGFTKAFREADINQDGKLSKKEAEEANKKWKGLFEFKENQIEEVFVKANKERLANTLNELQRKDAFNKAYEEMCKTKNNENPSDETNSLGYVKRLQQEYSEKLKEYKNSVINKESKSNVGL